MHILQLGKYYWPYHGGMETVVQTLSEGLVRRGYSVRVLCASEAGASDTQFINGVSVTKVRTLGTFFSQPLMLGLKDVLKEALARTDLVHIHSPHPFMEKVLLDLNPSVPVVMTYHSDVVRQKILIPYYQKHLDKMLSRADRVVLTSHEYLNSSPFISGYKDKCEVNPIGILDPEETISEKTVATRNSLRQKYGSFALFVGRIVPYKGIRYLIKAMKSVDMNLVIVGDGPERSKLTRMCQRFGVKHKVHWIGSVKNQDDLNAYYSAADFFVLPSISRNEAFGVSLLEAMSFGKPCISTNIETGIQSVNSHEETGLVVPKMDAQALANAIRYLSENPELRLRYSLAARENFQINFKAADMLNRYTQLYHQLIPLKEAFQQPHPQFQERLGNVF